jgi:hypothetical protein
MLNYTLKKKKVRGAMNSTFLALIPKEVNLSNFNRFHPISLYNSAYKILTKIIANKIRPILSRLISDNQGGFMANIGKLLIISFFFRKPFTIVV